MASICFDVLINLLINDVQKVQASQGSKCELCVRFVVTYVDESYWYRPYCRYTHC